MNFDTEFMKVAIEEGRLALASDEVPIGAVIAKDNKIIARAHNQRESWQDPTAHAEIIALKEAANEVKNWRLMGCTLYVTMEPCPMCAGAVQQARVTRIVYGAKDPKAGAAGSIMNIVDNPNLNHRLLVTGGVEEKKCQELLNLFFRRLR